MFGVLWYVAWFVLAFESPSVHPTITEEERAYIELSAVNTDEVTFSRQIFEHHLKCQHALDRGSVKRAATLRERRDGNSCNLSSFSPLVCLILPLLRPSGVMKNALLLTIYLQLVSSSSDKINDISSQVTQGFVPWKSILTSLPVWGIIVAAFASDWGLYVLLICIPSFLMDILHYEVTAVSQISSSFQKLEKYICNVNPTSLFSFFLFQVGFAAAAPFVCKALSCPLAGITADLFRQNLFSTKTVRRMYYATGNNGLICISEEAPLKRVHT